ncbi:MAG TPA: FtsK/SpoIIIE domain-containing protein, partial [Mycobacteriales bacterium]|nr:FtsK/SpoIIIE domain-containing protein [Mycobacteriales bacterium]
DRPPRTGGERAAPALRVPAPLGAGYSPRFSWATVIAPLVLGAVLAVAMPGNRMFLLFMLLSPVLAVAGWGEERRRARKEGARGRADLARQLAELADGVVREQDHELRRRRATTPDLAETLRRCDLPSGRLWERRPVHGDFGLVSVGHADQPWLPPLDQPIERAVEADALLAAVPVLAAAPVAVRLAAGRTLGIAGPRRQALALARAVVVQAAVHHGPADLLIAVLTDDGRAGDWDFAKWLPHVRTGDGALLLAADPADRDRLLATLTDLDPRAALHLVVMDADGLTAGRASPARELLRADGAPVTGLVVAARVDDLPAACTDVVEIDDPDGLARHCEPASGGRLERVMVAGLSADTARAAALDLARYDDADLVEPGADLPAVVPLGAVLADGVPTADALVTRWSRPPTGRLAAPVGARAGGPLVIDLVGDGPHALIAGTTGSGKSELLRTLVASLAATYSPRDVNFVLIDYKGGSAFADCAALPHTVGVVTDLDPRLGARALVCLEAELRHRERLLRAAGSPDVAAHIAAGQPGGPIARLVVVIDEFATMAAELPDFVDALVGIAQRGRSLGVHLVLATQRPAGAVKDNIRANTNLRIALRVHDAPDSVDVLGSPVAASLSRRVPGRAFLRLGPGELLAFQAGIVSTSSAAAADLPPVTVTELAFGPGAPTVGLAETQPDEPSDLATLVRAAADAAARLRLPPPRQPWPDPLPADVLLDQLPAAGDVAGPLGGWSAPIGLVDQPEEQRQCSYSWRSWLGGLLVYGVAGSGTSTTLATLALSLAARHRVDELHLYVMDFGSQLLTPLVDLPHVGAVIKPAERERQERLVRWLRAEVGRRQSLRQPLADRAVRARDAAVPTGPSAAPPAVVLLLDNWSGFEAAFDDLAGVGVRDDLVRVIADGPALGIFAVLSADRVMAVPTAVSALIPEKLVLRLSDQHDYGMFGLPVRDLPAFPPGRAIDASSRCEVQVARPGGAGLAGAVAAVDAAAALGGRCGTGAGAPRRIETLPDEVKVADLGDRPRVGRDEWWLPVGIGDRTLTPVGLRLADGEHALVAGAGRSGRTSLLCALAGSVTQHLPDARVVVVAGLRSALRDVAACSAVYHPAELAGAVAAVVESGRPTLLLIDDAERIDDDSGCLRRHLVAARPGDRVVAAGRADVLRTSYGHWTELLRRSRQGVVLKPQPAVDGDLWGLVLPRRRTQPFATGRGFLVSDGDVELVQAVRP